MVGFALLLVFSFFSGAGAVIRSPLRLALHTTLPKRGIYGLCLPRGYYAVEAACKYAPRVLAGASVAGLCAYAASGDKDVVLDVGEAEQAGAAPQALAVGYFRTLVSVTHSVLASRGNCARDWARS